MTEQQSVQNPSFRCSALCAQWMVASGPYAPQKHVPVVPRWRNHFTVHCIGYFYVRSHVSHYNHCVFVPGEQRLQVYLICWSSKHIIYQNTCTNVFKNYLETVINLFIVFIILNLKKILKRSFIFSFTLIYDRFSAVSDFWMLLCAI